VDVCSAFIIDLLSQYSTTDEHKLTVVIVIVNAEFIFYYTMLCINNIARTMLTA